MAKGATEDLYSLVMGRDRHMTLDVAAAIVREAPEGAGGPYAANIQRAVTRAVLDEGLRADDAAIMARSLRQAYAARAEAKGMRQTDLFGDDETFELAMGLEAKFAARKVAEIDYDLRGLKTAAGRQSGNLAVREGLVRKYGLRGADDAEGMAKTIAQLEERKRRWQNYYTDPELARQASAFARETLHMDDPVVETADGRLGTLEGLMGEAEGEANAQRRAEAERADAREAEEGVLANIIGERGANRVALSGDNELYEGLNAAIDALNARGGRWSALSRGEREAFVRRYGWQPGVDGKWRHEITPGEMDFRPGLETGKAEVEFDGERSLAKRFFLRDVFPSGVLYAAYPRLRRVKVLLGGLAKTGVRGIAIPSQDVIFINTREAGTPEDLRHVLLHEVQHLIQAEEGFARGGSRKVAERALVTIGRSSPAERERLGRELVRVANEEYPGVETPEDYAAYRGLAGEVEARNVSSRDVLRRNDIEISPLLEETESVPRNLQLYVTEDGAVEFGQRTAEGVRLSPAPGTAGMQGPGRPEEDMAANGPGFVPLAPGENFAKIEAELKMLKGQAVANERLGISGSIASGRDVSKIAHSVNSTSGENIRAHQFAAKNVLRLYETADVAVRHGNKKTGGRGSGAKRYVRLFAPFRFDGQTYVALISQYEADTSGIHAVEALNVIRADELPNVTSRDPQENDTPNGIPSALTKEKIAYTLGDVNRTRPERLDGTPYPAEALLEDVRDAVARFELRAAGRVRSAEALGDADARGTLQEPRLLAGERILPEGAYPMEGRVGPLGGAPGSPAATNGRRALGLSDLVMIYHELTEGDLPKVISNRARMGRAYGKYRVGKNRIELAAQIFGLLDESDVDELRHRLTGQGYFRHLDPAWAAAARPATRKLEKARSEARLAQEVRRLARERVKQGQAGEREVKVMAHELWHLIDDQDGGLRGRGNLVGHLAALKYHMKEAFPVAGFAGNRELKAEAEGFIRWWRGVANPEDTAYFMGDPAETLAEVGAAFFVDPEALRAKAPKLYDALNYALAQHPKAQEAYDRAVAYVASGGKSERLAMMQGRTWTREAQSTMRAIVREATGTDHSLRRWRMRLNAYLWDRRGPAVMLYNEASRDSLRALRAELRAGRIGKADYEAAKARFDEGLTLLKKRHLDYTRLGSGLSRLYLADVRGVLGRYFAAVDPNPEIARAVVDEFAFNKRVLELGGRAAAYGTTAAEARAILNAMARRRGLDGMRRVITAWRAFRAVYERYVIESPAVQRMLGLKAIDLMRENASYVTMRHTLTPEQAERLRERLSDRRRANGAALEIALERLLPNGAAAGGSGAINQLRRLQGSLQATESPLLATMRTAVGLITAAERNAAVADLANALAASGHVEARVVPWGQRATNARHAPIEFWEGGEHKALMVPTIVAKGFMEGDDQALKALTYATRIINATLTTNNPGFVPRAQIKDFGAASYNIPGLWRTTTHYLNPVAGDVVALAGQFVPPHIMRKLGRVPVFRHLLFHPHTVEFWSSFGNRMARMIHSADFEGVLEEARQAWAAGNEAKARELEFLVQMSRAALRDGVLLNMVQFRGMEYNDSDWKALFARYNLDFDELPVGHEGALRKAIRLTAGAPKRAWNKIGDASEIASATVKLGVYCYLHRDAHPGLRDVTQAGSFADPLRRAEAAWRAATLAGDPTFELRGHLMTYLELSSGPFLNARQKGFLRTPGMLLGTGEWLRDDETFRIEGPVRHTTEMTLKLLTTVGLRRIYYWALASGGLAAMTLGLFRLLKGKPEATEEDMKGTFLGG